MNKGVRVVFITGLGLYLKYIISDVDKDNYEKEATEQLEQQLTKVYRKMDNQSVINHDLSVTTLIFYLTIVWLS